MIQKENNRINLQSQPDEHSIVLPLVSKKEESIHLPLVINVVAKYWGEDLSPSVGETAAANQRGTLLIEGLELVERRGLVSFVYSGSTKDIKKRIDQGIPPIVIMPGIQELVQHATIVSGYSDKERRIFTYVPEPDTMGAVPESRFQDDWEQDDMTTIVIVPFDMKNVLDNENLKFNKSNKQCFEAERLRQLGRLDEAIDKLRMATEAEPNNPQAWCILGGIYNELGKDEAVSCYEKATKLNPKYYLAYRGLGNHYLKQHDYSLAETYYTKAIAINHNRFGPIYKNRAIARMQLGNNAGARQDLSMYLEQTPDAADKKTIREAVLQLQD